MHKLIPIALILLSSCAHVKNAKYEQLQDTLQKLKAEYDFRPLDSADAYAFINKYYLPRLDTMPTKRRIFIHPLIGERPYEIFQRDSVKLTRQFNKDTSKDEPEFAPRNVGYPILHSNWNQNRLNKTHVIIDTQMVTLYKQPDDTLVDKIRNWHKKFGYGYMLISYPLYNKTTGRIVMSDWVENADFCGTGRNHNFWYRKVAGGWKSY